MSKLHTCGYGYDDYRHVTRCRRRVVTKASAGVCPKCQFRPWACASCGAPRCACALLDEGKATGLYLHWRNGEPIIAFPAPPPPPPLLGMSKLREQRSAYLFEQTQEAKYLDRAARIRAGRQNQQEGPTMSPDEYREWILTARQAIGARS